MHEDDDPHCRYDLAEFQARLDPTRGLVLSPAGNPDSPDLVWRLTVAYGADGFAWATMVDRDGSLWRRWEGHDEVAEMVLRLLPAVRFGPADGACGR